MKEFEQCPLTGDAIRLMLRLHGAVTVDALADHFPRILNRIAEVWEKPIRADRYFVELLNNSRESHERLSKDALTEIRNLRAHHLLNNYRTAPGAWQFGAVAGSQPVR